MTRRCVWTTIEACCDTEDEHVVKEVAEYKKKEFLSRS